MKTTTILIGFAKTDASGNPLGQARIVSDPPKDDAERREQAALFDNAKRLHQFPKGIRYLAFVNCVAASVAAHISDEVSETVQADHQARQQLEMAEVNRKAALAKKARDLQTAKDRVRAAAVAENAARSTLAAATSVKSDAERQHKLSPTEPLKQALVAALEKSGAAEKSAKEALAELTAAKEALTKLTK